VIGADADGLAERSLAQIDRAKLGALEGRFRGHPFAKYFDAERWVRVNVARALLLELDAGPSRRVVDLGTGFGYFLLVCRVLGHEVQGVDLADPVYGAVTELLGVPVVHHRIEPRWPLPSLALASPDVVTAHMVCFNGHGTRSLWGVRDWSTFLNAFNGATLHLELNREPDGMLFPRGVAELFGDRGAVIARHHVVFGCVRPPRVG
jgi:hypothetical protein